MAYVPPDPSQPLPEEPDTQDLEDEYANVRDALAAAAAAAVAAGANATMSLGQFEGGAADVGGGPRGIQVALPTLTSRTYKRDAGLKAIARAPARTAARAAVSDALIPRMSVPSREPASAFEEPSGHSSTRATPSES